MWLEILDNLLSMHLVRETKKRFENYICMLTYQLHIKLSVTIGRLKNDLKQSVYYFCYVTLFFRSALAIYFALLQNCVRFEIVNVIKYFNKNLKLHLERIIISSKVYLKDLNKYCTLSTHISIYILNG